MGGREVPIKAVLQAIPSYVMSCFKLPDSVCHGIEQACAKFWWHDSQEKRGLHWVSWKHKCTPKSNGGMGFRNLATFNKALLAKQVCRIVQHPNSLMARVLKAKYFKHSDIMVAGLGYNPSFVWRSLMWGRELSKKRMCWRVGDGQNINIGNDPWIPSLSHFKCRSVVPVDSNMKVAS